MKKIIIGSYPFFSKYPDYKSHDVDYMIFEDNPIGYKNFKILRFMKKGSDCYYWRNMPKQEFIDYELNHINEVPMAINALLVPEVCQYKGITLEDLKQFEFAFEKMDKKHTYLKNIYDAYIKNGGFVLTNEQRNEAYKVYKEARK
jgi:hypothetical protein